MFNLMADLFLRLICLANLFFSAGMIIPLDKRLTWVSTANKTGFGNTFPTKPIVFRPIALIKPKPEIDALAAAPESNFAACLADLMRITSSVNVTVTAIASGSLNNLVNLLRLALS